MKIAIVGAGIVGCAIAHALLDEGHEVLILDKEGPGFGPSRGNAGWMAHTDILPIASPKILGRCRNSCSTRWAAGDPPGLFPETSALAAALRAGGAAGRL